MKSKAVIENITKNSVVLLVGKKEEEIHIPKEQIPRSINYKVGDWLDIRLEGESIEVIKVDSEETDKVRRRIQEKMERLRKRRDAK